MVSYKKCGARDEPGAVLSIPTLEMLAGVYSYTISKSPEAGISHVSDTSLPGEPVNVAIAGHRDSFFGRFESVALLEPE